MNATVGVIGGGQLARMLIPPAIALGVTLKVFAESSDASASLAVTDLGDFRDIDQVLAFAQTVDVLTFDHEHVPPTVLASLDHLGVVMRPGPHALRFSHDKIAMREALDTVGLAVPEWRTVVGASDVTDFLSAHGGRGVVKTARGGYDGRGVRVVSDSRGADDWLAALEAHGDERALLVEEVVPFRREVAQLVARRPSGEIAMWPLVETVQREGVCAEVIAPARGVDLKVSRAAAEIATEIATRLDVVGILAVELFETDDGRLLINELAMRPHNCGHWTIDGSTSSQFEQHLRAILDWPLGASENRELWSVMVNIIGGPSSGPLVDRYPAAMAAHPSVKIHNYGKVPRPGRKVGHVTAVGDDLDDVAYRARAAAAFFQD